MPIYEYRCKECHQIFEEWITQSGDEEPRKCPVCNGISRRIMSSTSFVLNGGGWYVTDYGYKSQIKTDGDAAAQSKTDSAANTAPAASAAPAAAPTPAVSTAPAANTAGPAS